MNRSLFPTDCSLFLPFLLLTNDFFPRASKWDHNISRWVTRCSKCSCICVQRQLIWNIDHFLFFFLTRNRFWPSYCQISTDLDKILSTPIVIRNTLVGRRRPWSARGRFQAKPELMYFLFYNTCNAPYPIYYIDDGSPRFRRQTVKVEVRTGAMVKNSGIL